MMNTSNKPIRPRRCRRCGRPTLTEFCSPSCAIAVMTEEKIDDFFPPEAHTEVRELMKKIERQG